MDAGDTRRLRGFGAVSLINLVSRVDVPYAKVNGMMRQAEQRAERCRKRSESLNATWRKLCDLYLPVQSSSIWRFSAEARAEAPSQGWKLHVPATVLNAGRVLSRVAPFLQHRNVLFKAPASLDELAKLNAGIFYGYSQVGKFLTVYPRTDSEVLIIARQMHRLTRGISAPSVPFDLEYRRNSCVYYRYGAFKAQETESHEGKSEAVIRAPDGHFVRDTRDSTAQPSWAHDPFTGNRAHSARDRVAPTPLQTTFKAFRALAQRGKGGVYQALDLSVRPPRVCILKEGRRYGEVSWNGRDGFWLVRQEQRALKGLARAGIKVPAVYSSFRTEKNYYLALEFIEGETLEQYLTRRQRKLGIPSALRQGLALARLMSDIHGAGWVWRDCKPRNIILAKSGELRPIDFEGACPIDEPDPFLWGTPSYTPPECALAFHGQSRLPEDLYALGVILFLLLVGRLPDSRSEPIRQQRRNIPAGVSALVADLLDLDPGRRPNARSAAVRLESELAARLSVCSTLEACSSRATRSKVVIGRPTNRPSKPSIALPI